MELDFSGGDKVALLGSPQYCRICRSHESRATDPLLSACACTGSVGKIHAQCLRQWIKSRRIPIDQALACELCKLTYRVVLRRRVRWDRRHGCSWASLGYLCVVLVLIGALVLVASLLVRLLQEAQHAPAANIIPVILLFGSSTIVSLVAVWRIFWRWFYVTSVTYVDAADGLFPATV
ncbi:hypothetical protein SPRG_08042 [Saprolegnia parasitica CBS 223.65]|uniref:RING-CH-type domain-containing protein n=1 Tax=Saprolegnia parasitica (strain CBS 223.65) TaxID=695850 RepID=A0A067C814_SAPPC|nr:hypothetical protein SPRG_08042 [Saprolegnia parasitica CBS 223.65]KDO26638.1 hypothetical protein SPRG_08042 [Saprolegnia parasitica CBS 223.65]|eukprot:XP_012202777.1 hypothetical protein SPRG_08042 [Saprolegnia parasitica CBS 223.65]